MVSSNTVELIFKHYIPIILIVAAIAVNYVAATERVEVGAFPLYKAGEVHAPFKAESTIFIMDLLTEEKILVRTSGLQFSYDYASEKCDSCVVYIEQSGIDYYILLVTIASIISYFAALRILGLNTRYLTIILILVIALFTSVETYSMYYTLPITTHKLYEETNILQNESNILVVDVDLKPNSLIAISTDVPVVVAYGSAGRGNNTFEFMAVNVREYTDYVETSKYNVVMLIPVGNQTVRSFTYRKVEFTQIRGDNLLLLYQPVIMLLLIIVAIVLFKRKIEQAEEETVRLQQSSTGSADQASQQRSSEQTYSGDSGSPRES